jgi:hypothetical protein
MDKLGNLIKWLFTDPMTACVDATAPTKSCQAVSVNGTTQYVEVFHFYPLWIALCVAGLLVYFYYNVEGRKRFVKGHALHKYMFDKITNEVALWALVGPFLIFGRWALDSSFFAYRFWRYAWLAWLAGIGIYWLVFLLRRYPGELAAHRAHHTMRRYMPDPRGKRRPAVKAGSR